MQHGKKSRLKHSSLIAGTLATLITGIIAACAQTQTQSPGATTSTSPATSSTFPVQKDKGTLPTPVALPPESFDQWRERFRQDAMRAGIDTATLDRALNGLSPDDAVIAADRSQPEFTRPVWEYLASAVSPTRVRNGQALLTQHAVLLNRLEARYGIEPERLVAFWGIESNYGSNMGTKNVIRSLATLAYEGRRPEFARTQLLAALGILQQGDITPESMIGSWAGAMGQTQFIPTTYNEHAVDFDADGRRDIWNSTADALASTANYLKASGWQDRKPWGFEVRLPQGFDYAQADMDIRKPLNEWTAMGIQGVSVALPSAYSTEQASVLLPAGHRGPAFLVFNNFRTILRYNNSSSYALAIGLLSDSYQGAGKVQAAWPLEDAPLSHSERIELQQRLSDKGFDPGTPDGIIGANTRRAIRAFQQTLGWPADGYPTPSLLARLRT
ncbi:membrane-bound lytic murein transglycosylase B [Pseudomonas duriflava]|uniref:Membrane-bound lytic murein transglycosylase B n=1 Tax=Pseudomonas duriflava TaxID=459528 RepID=A0A562QBZ0_9PSED|nr:lytic murein transglycosylase [Pseudomonas duriflava]TWI54244.1 membrane-bound lytic murein transglycosylase B [Pseudomonas duriflava]